MDELNDSTSVIRKSHERMDELNNSISVYSLASKSHAGMDKTNDSTSACSVSVNDDSLLDTSSNSTRTEYHKYYKRRKRKANRLELIIQNLASPVKDKVVKDFIQDLLK